MPSIMTQSNGDVTVVYFTDAQILDEHKIAQINEELMRVTDRNAAGKLLLNFSDVGFMSSAVLGKIVNINKKCKADGTTLKLCNISPNILEVFKIMRLNKVLEIHDTEEKALSAFNKKGWFG